MRRSVRSFIRAVAVSLSVLIVFSMLSASGMSSSGVTTAAAQSVGSGPCGLSQVAFCDTFDRAAGTGDRAGDLNGTVWGVSRVTTGVNTGQGQLYDWLPTNKQLCGGSNVFPDQDVRICNGQVTTAVNDGHNQTVLAMYPKQPFDIAGRTGTVVFDVGNDTQGAHAAWPEFWYTDQPVPGPNGQSLPGISTTPRNGFGLSIAGVCNQASNRSCYPTNGCPNTNDVMLDSMTVVTNYVAQSISFTKDGCVRQPSAAGQLNHFEVHLSTSGVQVYGTDAGVMAPLKLIAHATFGQQLPLTRGLIWAEDVHYAACKFDTQCDHAFIWDNIGFDGPVLARDLTFDVPEAKIVRSDGTMQLGWKAPNSTTEPLTLTIPNVTNVAQATGALLTLTLGAQEPTAAISYSLNGSAWATQPWVFDGTGYTQRTIGIAVPVQHVVTGTNTLRLSTNQSSAVANVDLVLIGAGGVVGPGGSNPMPTNSPTSDPTEATPTPPSGPGDSILPTVIPVGVDFVTTVQMSSTAASAGSTEEILASATSRVATQALVDVEVYDPRGHKTFQRWFDNQSFAAAERKTFVASWAIPSTAEKTVYTVKIGIFSPGWRTLFAWNGHAAQFTVG